MIGLSYPVLVPRPIPWPISLARISTSLLYPHLVAGGKCFAASAVVLPRLISPIADSRRGARVSVHTTLFLSLSFRGRRSRFDRCTFRPPQTLPRNPSRRLDRRPG